MGVCGNGLLNKLQDFRSNVSTAWANRLDIGHGILFVTINSNEKIRTRIL